MSVARPRLLFLSQTLPYPPDGGVAIRTFNVLRLLAGTFDVTALCFYRSKGGSVDARLAQDVNALQRYAAVEAFPIPQEHSRLRLLADHLISTVSGTVYTRFAYRSRAFRSRLERVLREQNFDLVHVDSLDLSDYLPMLGELPVVCVHHNHESRLLQRRAAVERSAVRRAYLRHQATLMAAEERDWCPRVSLNVVVSDEDARSLRSEAPNAKFQVVPNGVDVDAFTPGAASSDGIVFVGGSTWFPNRDALGYFVQEILPFIQTALPNATVNWIGRVRDEDRSAYRTIKGLQLVGYVDDIRPHVREAACYVVPLRVGGGTRLKILDAWALGKAIVTTSVGCEGLAARDGENLLVRDDPRKFAEAVVQVLQDCVLRRKLELAARATAEQQYDWRIIGEPMQRAYLSLIRRREAPVRV